MDIWFAAFAAPPYHVEPSARPLIEAAFRAHLREPGFRLVAACEGKTPLGFAYGFMRRPGQDWVEEVARALGPRARLLEGAFGFVEIAVRPEHQRKGVGSALHDALLEGVRAPRAVLTVHEKAPALDFYLRRGWHRLGALVGAPYLVLAKPLQDQG
jgi:GNAT superfamily N-acetyltransferase